MEADQCPARADFDFCDLRDERILLDLDKLEQILRRFGDRTKAIGHLCGEAFDVLTFFEIVQAAIQRHADRQVGDIILRNKYRCVDGDLRREAAARLGQTLRASAGLQDRFFKHRLI